MEDTARALTYGSLFAGIKGDKGFSDAGWECKWAVEIEPFCQAVLRTHYPSLPIFGDIHKCGSHNLAAVDLVTAGVPCQDVSVAGKRAGLKGARTGLFYEFARILRELRPAWFVFENVPGLFSSNGGRDFAEVLRVLMVECGYGVSWRVLNSQFFGVAQRRRRVFIVGRFGKPCPAEILFESASGAGDIAPGEEKRPELASELAACIRGFGGTRRGWNNDAEQGLVLSPTIGADIRRQAGGHPGVEEYCAAVLAATLTEHHPGQSNRWAGRNEADNLIAAPIGCGLAKLRHDQDGYPEHIVIQDVRGGTRDKTDSGQGIGIREGGPSYTLGAVERHAVAFAENQRGEIRTSDISPQLSTSGGKPGSGYSAALVSPPLRTSIGAKGHPGDPSRDEIRASLVCAPPDADRVRDLAGLPEGLDSPRYRALGNAWTVQVGRWIAERIKARVNADTLGGRGAAGAVG